MAKKKSVSERSLSNLKPFQKGKSGNPTGRPVKAMTFSDTAREMLSAKSMDITYSYCKNKNTTTKTVSLSSTENLYHGIAAALISEALDGNVRAAKELLNRAEGTVAQSVDLTSKGDRIENSAVIQVIDKETAAAVKKMIEK